MKVFSIQLLFLLLLAHPLKAQSAIELNRDAEQLLTSYPEKAKTLLQKAIRNKPDKNLEQKIKLNLAIVDRMQGNFNQAINASTAILSNTSSNEIKASAHNNLGSSYNRTGNKEKALEHYIAALKIYEKHKLSREAATVENNIGLMYQNLEDFDKALEFHTSAIKKFTNLNDQKGLATSNNLIGIVLANQGDLEGALRCFKKTYELEKKENNAVGISEALNNIGGVYHYLNELDSAFLYFNKSLAIDRINHDYSNLADGYNNLAELHLSAGKYKIASHLLDSSIYFAKKTNYHQAYLQALKMYILLYEEENNLEQVIAYQKRLLKAKDSIAQVSNRANLNELEKKYQLEKKETAIKEEQLKNNNKSLWMLILGAGILILITLIIVILQRKKMQLQRATIENMKNLDAERTRIARDLHDNLGAELTLISSKIDVKSFKSTNEHERRELEEIREISTMANDVLRDTIWSIHKHELTAEELKAKAIDYLNRINIHPQIKLSVKTDKSQTYSPSIVLHLFRIIQEATNNALKYSCCTELTVKILPNTLIIKDNGIGFDISTAAMGYGLLNMKARANEMNAQLTINSSLEKGTTIQLDF